MPERKGLSNAVLASKIYSVFLTVEKGWWFLKGSDKLLCNYIYVPGSITQCKRTKLLKEGTMGIHYAYDDEELGEMIKRFGVNHKPQFGQDPVELSCSEKKSLVQIWSDIQEELNRKAIEGEEDNDRSDANDDASESVSAGAVVNGRPEEMAEETDKAPKETASQEDTEAAAEDTAEEEGPVDGNDASGGETQDNIEAMAEEDGSRSMDVLADLQMDIFDEESSERLQMATGKGEASPDTDESGSAEAGKICFYTEYSLQYLSVCISQ